MDECSDTSILPDGCRDVIVAVARNAVPTCFVSELFNGPHYSRIESGTELLGIRFRPGTVIDEMKLARVMSEKYIGVIEQQNRVIEIAKICSKVQESLLCIADSLSPIPLVASELGVSVRSLQRVVSDATGRSPVYWRALARARQTARNLQQSSCLAELSFNAGYADQSHMNREFQRWFGVSPVVFAESPGLFSQLDSPAFC